MRRPLGLGGDEVLEFTTVEVDPSALSALVHVDAIALICAHLGLALWARN